jgi:peptidoglycan/xylan/chitin deacetylase (PgdA/CDA1 family)
MRKIVNSWLRDVVKRRGWKGFIKQLLLMSKYHGILTDRFTVSLKRFISTVEKYDAKCTFPIVAYVGLRHEEIVKYIVKNEHKIASHGFIHVNFERLGYSEQLEMLKLSLKILNEIAECRIIGLRTPYQLYNEETFRAITDAGFLYDSSIHFSEPKKPFIIKVNDKKSFIEIPWTLSEPSLIDKHNVSPQTLLKIWLKILEKCGEGEVLTLDAHPVRMGTERYIETLDGLLHHAKKHDFDILSLDEAYTKFISGKLSKPALALSGDIDCVILKDYLYRLLKKA